MPTSNLATWPAILHLVHEVRPERVLDVGPGWGKAGILLREYCGVARVDAVEAWRPYIDRMPRGLYDEVFDCDVLDLGSDELAAYDVVLMVEVIEHMEKPAASELLERIPGHVVICTPRDWFQNPEHIDIPPEAHRSLWCSADFGDRLECEDVAAHDTMGAVLVRLSRRA